MGYTIREETPVPPFAGNEIQLFDGMLNLFSWRVSSYKNLNKN